MPKRSELVQDGRFSGLPENIAKQIGEPRHLSTEPGYNDCWPWKGMISGGGDTNRLPYGRSKTWTSKEKLVHRIMYEWKNGPIQDGLKVLHLCNYPLCCNPGHLKLGTQQENMQHMATSKRASDVRGVKNPKSILSPAQVLEIRRAFAGGETGKSIARRMKIEKGTVDANLLRDPSDRSKYRFWKDVGGPMRPDGIRRKPHDKFGPCAESIRMEYQAGATVNELAQKWDASQGAIQGILLGVRHADRPGPTFSSPLSWGNAPTGRPMQRLAAVAREIRLAYENQGTADDLAEKYYVTPGSIAKLLLGKTYPNEGGPIFTKPIRYSDITIRPSKNEPRYVVRTQGKVASGKFAGLPQSVARRIGEPVDYEDAMGYKSCWPWTGYKKSGYGGGRKLAHVTTYEWKNGPVPPGLVVMHLCNQRNCCNPEHLKAGTHTENMRYMAASGRASRLTATDSPVCRYTPSLVLEVRTRHAAGESLSVIASEMGFTRTDIDHLVVYDRENECYRFWQEVGGPVRPAKNRSHRNQMILLLSDDEMNRVAVDSATIR